MGVSAGDPGKGLNSKCGFGLQKMACSPYQNSGEVGLMTALDGVLQLVDFSETQSIGAAVIV